MLPAGQAVITGGGDLAARYVIHTVGPVYKEEECEKLCEALLADCYRNSLAILRYRWPGTIAFPCISTGAYLIPRPRPARLRCEPCARNWSGMGRVMK